MNAETNELLRRMEQATVATPVDRSTLDDETAMLRENWLVLGKLLRAGESQLEQPERVEVVELRRPAVVRRSWRLVMGCVVSALAVIGLCLVVWTTHSHNGALQMANRPQPDRGASSGGLWSEAPQPANVGALELAWEDNWDSDFAQTALALQQFHGEQRTRDSSLSRLQGEFQELARDFESGSL